MDPDSKVHGAKMEPIWDPGGPNVGPMNFAISEHYDLVYIIGFRK